MTALRIAGWPSWGMAARLMDLFFSLVLRPVEVVFGPFAGVARPQ